MKPSSALYGILGFLSFSGSYILSMSIFRPDYDMARITPLMYLPENQMRPPIQYFYDSHWRWGGVWDSFTVQLDVPVVTLLVVVVAILSAKFLSLKNKLSACQAARAPILVLSLVAAISLLLQLPLAIPFYQSFPGAAYLQFPWRLLAIISPCLIVLALIGCQALSNVALRNAAALSTLTAVIYFSGASAPINYGTIQVPQGLEGHSIFSAFNEYVPTAAGLSLSPATKRILTQQRQGSCISNENPGLRKETEETLSKTYTLKCLKPQIYALPVFASALHRVVIKQTDVEGSRSERCISPGLHNGLCAVDLGSEGIYTVTVFMPTMGEVYKSMLGNVGL